MDRREFFAALGGALVVSSSFEAGAQTPVTARLGFIPVIGAAPVFIAEREGWLKEKGLTFITTVFESGPNMIQAVASGTLDIYVAGVAPLAVARSRGIDIRVVAATATAENVLVANAKLAAYFKPGVSGGAALKAYRAAEGKPARLATQPAGSVPNTTLQHWLWEVAKADKADVEIVPMGIDATQQAILVGAVDGGSVREPALTILQSRNGAIRLIASGDEMFPGQPGTVVAVTGDFITRHPEAVQALVSNLVRAAELLTKEPKRAVPHIEAALGKGLVETAIIEKALVSPATRFLIDPRELIAPARAMQAYQVKLGSLDKELPFDGLFESRFFEAAKAGR